MHSDELDLELVACRYVSVFGCSLWLHLLEPGTFVAISPRDESDPACSGANAFRI